MKIVSARWGRSRACDRPELLPLRGGLLPLRGGLILALADDEARLGRGEATPLAGYSIDTLEDVRDSFEALARSLPVQVSDDPGPTDELEAFLPDGSAAARFAIETALLDLWSQRRGVSTATLLAQGGPVRPVELSTLLTGTTAAEALRCAERALARGIRVFKRKVAGRSMDAEIAILASIRRHCGPAVELRVDANGAWDLAAARRHLHALAALGIAFVEEPVAGEALLALGGTPVPWAADESLRLPGFAERASREAGCAAFILKPMLLGGALRCRRLAALAAAHGKSVVVTHMFDGPVALEACEALARSLPVAPRACGLDDEHLSARRTSPHPHPLPGGEGVGGAQPPRSRAPGCRGAAADLLSLRRAARREPGRVALVAEGRTWTYRALSTLVDARCDALRGYERIVWVADASLDSVVTVHAGLELGLPLVPLHPRLTAAERDGLVELVEASGPTTASAVVFTTGTTGRPRAATLTRANLMASALASVRHLDLTMDDVWLACLPLAHVSGLAILLRSVVCRGTVVLEPRFVPERILSLLGSGAPRPTLVSLVPTMLRSLLDRDDVRALARPRAILLGGAHAPSALLEDCRSRGLRVLTTYGLTETCAQVTCQSPGDPVGAEQGAGRPLPGVELRIEGGRIQVRGPSVMAGYLGEQRDPLRWLDTGDLGHLDPQGRLHVEGRAGDLIVTGGENVSPQEVEGVLEAFPGIEAAAVYGVPDDTWGQIVSAALVPARGSLPLEQDLTAYMNEHLAPHKRPRRIAWVASLPRNEGGKLIRTALREAVSTRAVRTPAGPPEESREV